ncbi:Polyphosphate kinase [[Pasteurella] aerogenes]|nr:Polyphosphate kinase [[Pasteurella] aerogenes]
MGNDKHKEPSMINREVSLMYFNERVLAMAANPKVPLLERLRYVCIVSSNLDEFFEVRIASLKQKIARGKNNVNEDGLTPEQAFLQVQKQVHALVDKQYQLLNHSIFPKLQKYGIYLFEQQDYTDEIYAWAKGVFQEEIQPLLTPIGLDPAHPFPCVLNKSLNFIVSLEGQDAFGREASIAIVQLPRALPRLIKIPENVCGVPHGYTLLSVLMQLFVGELFPGLTTKGIYRWRVTRDSDLYLQLEEVSDLFVALQEELSQRNFGNAVRLEVISDMPKKLVRFLQKEFNLQEADTYYSNGSVNLTRIMPLADIDVDPSLKFPPYTPPIPEPFYSLGRVSDTPEEMFAAIAKQDLLLHHPYESFQPVIDFLTAAACDPNVVAIKQTIYRTGEDSELMELLLKAARAGKEVTVIVELMARFDEQTNSNWAEKLEEVGAHVVYGVVGHKTHAKMMLVLRREKRKIVRYGHLGTGNYHPRTARLYTDFGLLTCDKEITEDMDKVFSLLTGLGARRPLKTLLQSPFTLHSTMMDLIRAEIQQAQQGNKAKIMLKMNSLIEPQAINALYEASQAGVEIDLVVRGTCRLRAGLPGLSENIRLISIVGRFLEHSRIFYFYHQGEERVYLSSADWMDRNFFHRVELACPIKDDSLKQRIIHESFTMALKDNRLAWKGLPDGRYEPVRNRRRAFNLHQRLMKS